MNTKAELIPAVFNGATTAPIFADSVSAGFPSPAEDFIDSTLNLHEYLIQHPSATFFLRVSGESMVGVGIQSGDILVVDRSIALSHNKIVIAQLGSEFLVKRLSIVRGQTYLLAENPDYPAINITDNPDCTIWGVVTSSIHKF